MPSKERTYFIPTIEDFIPGLLYKQQDSVSNWLTVQCTEEDFELRGCTSRIADIKWTLKKMNKAFPEIVVPYLTEEDLEERGFKKDDTLDSFILYKKYNCSIKFFPNSKLEILIDEDRIFIGTVLTVAELDKLFEQLGIKKNNQRLLKLKRTDENY